MRKLSGYIWITIGLVLYSIGYMFFWSPYQIVAGGITGLSLIIRDSTGIPFAISNNVINIALLLIAIKFLGTHFGIKTIYATIVLSLILTILEPFATKPLIDSIMMSVVLGGLFCGFGVGITFSNGGSTGGTDIISMIVQKFFHIAIGRISFYINMGIIGSAYFIYNSLEIIIYGIVAMGISSYFLDKYLQGNRQSSEIKIVSSKFSDIADKITQTGRGVTVYEGTGWYTRNEKQVVTAIVSKKEEHIIIRMVQEIDPKAFVSVSTVKTVYGQGFDIGVF
jgi:uncharacterized membrane-anchored protein YitT (DUF2179 family)